MPSISIIGKGLVGSFAVLHFLQETDWIIHWYYDENKQTESVGEATTLEIPNFLRSVLNFTNEELLKANGTPKTGIKKYNWGKVNRSYIHPFWGGNHGFHFTAKEIQKQIYKTIEKNQRVLIYNKNIENPESLKTNFVMVASGRPDLYDEKVVHIEENIPVNTAYVVNCYWDNARFLDSLHVARPHGWVFGIPLQNRVSIGYLYNRNITTKEEIEKDIQNVFDQFNLTPSDEVQNIPFTSFRRKENFTSRVAYTGNASFFLEPLESTSTTASIWGIRLSSGVFQKQISVEEAQLEYKKGIRESQNMILLHYMAGSVFKTNFWKYAQPMAKQKIENEIKQRTPWAKFLHSSLKDYTQMEDHVGAGTWGPFNYNLNCERLGIKTELLELFKKYKY